METKYLEQLKALGFTDNEVRIYLTLLRKSGLNAYQVSEKTGLHRGYVYDALKRMQEKNIVTIKNKENKKVFQAIKPEELYLLMKIKIDNLKDIIPELNKQLETEKKDTEVELFTGKDCFKTMILHVMETRKVPEKEGLFSIGVNEEEFEEKASVIIEKYFNTINEQGLKDRCIVQTGTRPHPKAKNTEYRCLPYEYVAASTIAIYCDFTVIVTSGTPTTLIRIKNQKIADTFRKQLAPLWQMAKLVKKT